jgi:hypothetical protein
MTEPRPEAKLEVIKHSAAIQIESNITLLQRRAWNILLYNAYSELPSEEIHSIRVQDLIRLLEYDSKNEAYLKEALEALVGCTVKWNILDKDGSETWGIAALLASAEVKNGLCTYAFAAHLRPRLHNPRIYARINLSLQNKFESKHAQTLWELCTDYLGAVREQGETPYIPLDQFRDLMGISEEKYSLFKLLSQWVLKPALAEINRLSDFRVSMDYQRQGRKVTALKFRIRRVVMLPSEASRQPDLFPDLADMPSVLKRLVGAGLTVRDTLGIWNQGFEAVEPGQRPQAGADFAQYLEEKLALLKLRQERGAVKNASGFLLTAIRKNYTNAELEQHEARKRGGIKKRQQGEELRALRAQQDTIEQEWKEVFEQICKTVIETFPDMVTRAVEALREQHAAAFRFCYDADKSPAENYKRHRYISEVINQWLEHQLPEEFENKRLPYIEKLEEIRARISALTEATVEA